MVKEFNQESPDYPVGADVRRLTSNAEFGMRSAELDQSLLTSSPTISKHALNRPRPEKARHEELPD